jgi:hypothetical protein
LIATLKWSGTEAAKRSAIGYFRYYAAAKQSKRGISLQKSGLRPQLWIRNMADRNLFYRQKIWLSLFMRKRDNDGNRKRQIKSAGDRCPGIEGLSVVEQKP